jgi:hypothetical protein
VSDRDLAEQADAAFRKTTSTYSTWLKNVKAGKYPASGPPSQFGIGFGLLAQIGQAAPVDPPPAVPPTGPLTISKGGVYVVKATGTATQAAGHSLFLSHFATCPNAATHRRATEPSRAEAKPKEGPVICDALPPI